MWCLMQPETGDVCLVLDQLLQADTIAINLSSMTQETSLPIKLAGC